MNRHPCTDFYCGPEFLLQIFLFFYSLGYTHKHNIFIVWSMAIGLLSPLRIFSHQCIRRVEYYNNNTLRTNKMGLIFFFCCVNPGPFMEGLKFRINYYENINKINFIHTVFVHPSLNCVQYVYV